MDVEVYFSDHFGVRRSSVERYGALDISLVADLPLFLDPFLLFNSRRRVYRALHQQIIDYLVFLRDKAADGSLSPPLIDSWYRFKEVKQTWLGFSRTGNEGAGLGRDFATALHSNLHRLFQDFGGEQRITRSDHLEKLCLIKEGVGRDKISDFTTRLILHHLCEYTERFTRKHLRRPLKKRFSVPRVQFDYKTETWRSGTYTLPRFGGTFVLLTPRDLLTREDTWINRAELIDRFEELPQAVDNAQLRAEVENYFRRLLSRKKRIREEDRRRAAARTIERFPQLIDYYIRLKEDTGDKAAAVSQERVSQAERVFLTQLGVFVKALLAHTRFYALAGNTYDEAMERLEYLKEEIEDRGGWRIFYDGKTPIEREADVHILYRLVWFGTSSDVNPEANSGRGAADFTISRGAVDKSLVEFKLASNSQLRRNLQKQVEIYKKSARAQRAIKAVVYFSLAQRRRVENILKDLGLTGSPDIVLIDARRDNKAAGSKA
ncbi:MAG: hypothetical protein JXP73_11810 [Deltaproteobacteria bacterium]|nr:hypothetical protein [Deltaproteobacteria bacterium]